ncbi:MAG: UPF0149 family protein [Gammaproteobacteria bacterium]|nr:UPF0149 family protein [Gammaproteobacteria bacterium]MDP6616732.1 UPF0149 family protein [Gammaproteobacteria bacterium]MDP6695203.1 UPF0149 family protein [Gammaproteobacteria bacterium]MDP7041871.1 UPF0149 family protein [Gammaproteobacteria bacterium]
MPDHQTDDFDDIERLLTVAGSAWDAAEAHGAFCGMACLGGAGAISEWVEELFAASDRDDVLAEERAVVLRQLAAKTLLSLEAGDMRFTLLLPDDDGPLHDRTAGLADWCHGFMHGLATAGGADEGPQADALDASIPAEILDDFSEITRAGVDEGGGEESEQAFAELVEYVRVSAQLVYDETMALRPSGENHKGNRASG